MFWVGVNPQYELFRAFYIDFEIHFDVEKIRSFLHFRKMNLNHNFFEFFKNTKMIKINNKLLKQIFQK